MADIRPQKSVSENAKPLGSDVGAIPPARQSDDHAGIVKPLAGRGLMPRPDDVGAMYTRRLSGRAKALIALIAAIAIGGGGYLISQYQSANDVPPGFARGNGRLEAERVDIATKYAGRLEQVRVAEGDWVTANEVVAVMDTATLAAQLREAEAATRQAEQQLDQAKALVAQRKSELTFAQQEFDRASQLAKNGFATRQQVEQRQSAVLSAEAALRSANAQASLSNAVIEASTARADAVKVQIADSTLVAPRTGRVQYRLALPGEVLPAGGRVVTLLDLTDVYLTIFLPTQDAGRLALGSEARIVFDAAPQYVVPATVSYVSSEAQFTPKYVETQSEREKLMFRIKLKIAGDILEKYANLVKAGLTGVAYVKVARNAAWPENLQVKLP